MNVALNVLLLYVISLIVDNVQFAR